MPSAGVTMNRFRIRGRDEGFTLIELLVAIGVFAVLMAIVTTLFVRGIRTMQVAQLGSTSQAQQQNAMEWLTRLVRYADNPVEGASPPPAVTEATANSMTFTTYSGTGPVDRLPYLVHIARTSAGVISQIHTPANASGTAVLTNGLPSYTGVPATRTLVQTTSQQSPTISFRYWSLSNQVSTELVPPAGASLTAEQMRAISTVDITISDSASVQSLVQTVFLENPR
ncbi:MAG: prepilin-type N-terminal cleavage/methylation domain-containing protein [Actinomycetota bacterium]|nr:prepilin-type N-terminal cleavage/methylation domain-containing protein [Actinomycetota bacterium]